MSMRIKRVINIFSIPLESSVFESHSANIAAQSQLEDFLTGCTAIYGKGYQMWQLVVNLYNYHVKPI